MSKILKGIESGTYAFLLILFILASARGGAA